ncbi:hypothetical protein ACHAWU_007356 [Discostella pseudostelligera]|uniref:Uncharacterized protein n=1 Tax=Discostella pseudostelligera TaxID=259834 RepID=A0ABD3M040_9STRA
MHHHQHHRPMQRSALSATFDFWYAPSTSTSSSSSSTSTSEGSTTTAAAATTDGLSTTSQPLLPAPHAQLLFDDEHPSFVELKGQDHRQPQQHEEHDDESDEDEDEDDDIMLMMEVEAAAAATTTSTTMQGPPLPHIFGDRSSSSSWRGGGVGARRQTYDQPRRPSWLSLGFARPRSESALLTMKSSTSSPTAPTIEAVRENNSNNNKLKRVHDESIIHSLPPGLVRVPSGSSLDGDCSSSTSSSSSDDSSCSASPSTTTSTSSQKSCRPKGVSFSLTVTVQPIPHSSLLSHSQRLRMYTSSDEVRKNKIRNKMEYRHDGYDWRNVSEEWEMGVDMVTGELVHPVHEMQQVVHHHHHHQRL